MSAVQLGQASEIADMRTKVIVVGRRAGVSAAHPRSGAHDLQPRRVTAFVGPSDSALGCVAHYKSLLGTLVARSDRHDSTHKDSSAFVSTGARWRTAYCPLTMPIPVSPW